MTVRPPRRCLGAALLAALAGLLFGASPVAATSQAGWRLPLPGAPEVVRGFEPPPTPYAAGHRGVDLRAVPGARVVAAAAGTVTFAGPVAGRPVVVVTHAGGLRTTYEPVAATVRRGAALAAGAVLGSVVVAGSHCLPGACLHWGLRRGDTYLDPLTMLADRPVRLLPLWDVAQPASPSAAGGARAASPARGDARSHQRLVAGVGAALLVASAAASTSAARGRAAGGPARGP
jgi:murein DD-endopeptidase MepM/ murein hydrolase activator NlpD